MLSFLLMLVSGCVLAVLLETTTSSSVTIARAIARTPRVPQQAIGGSICAWAVRDCASL